MENKLRIVLQELEGYKRGTGDFEYKIKQYADANEDLKRKVLELAEANKTLPEYENRSLFSVRNWRKLIITSGLKLMSSEHFNNKMMGLGEPKVKFNINLVASSSLKLSQSKTRIRKLEGDYDLLQRKFQEYEIDFNRKQADYGNRIATLNQEI